MTTKLQRLLMARRGRPTLFAGIAPEEWGYGGGRRMGLGEIGEHPAYVGLPGEFLLHPEERRWLEGGRDRTARRYRPMLRAAVEGRPSGLPTMSELDALYHAGRLARGEYGESARHIAGMVGTDPAAIWSLASGTYSAQTPWQDHSGAGLALLGDWTKAGMPTSPAALKKITAGVAGMRGPTGGPTKAAGSGRTWAWAALNALKQGKVQDQLANHKKYLQLMAHLNHPDPRVRAQAARFFIANTTGRDAKGKAKPPQWKTPNFGTAGMPPPYGDIHGMPADFVMGTTMVPTYDEMLGGHREMVRQVEQINRKREREGKKPLPPFDQRGRVMDMLRQIAKRHGLQGGDLAHPMLEDIGRMRTGDIYREGKGDESQMMEVMKAAQEGLWNAPDTSLAMKALMGQLAWEKGAQEGREVQEAPWAGIQGVIGAKDLDPSGLMRPRDVLTEQSAGANWDVLGALAGDRNRDDWLRAGASSRDVDDLTRLVARRRSAVLPGAAPKIPKHLEAAFDSVAARLPPGGYKGGAAGRAVLQQLIDRKLLSIDPGTGKVKWKPGRGVKYNRPGRPERFAAGVLARTFHQSLQADAHDRGRWGMLGMHMADSGFPAAAALMHHLGTKGHPIAVPPGLPAYNHMVIRPPGTMMGHPTKLGAVGHIGGVPVRLQKFTNGWNAQVLGSSGMPLGSAYIPHDHGLGLLSELRAPDGDAVGHARITQLQNQLGLQQATRREPMRRPGVAEPFRARPGVPGGYQTALAVARSRAAMAISKAVSRSLGQLGVAPHRVSRAVLSSGGRFLPAAVASVYRDVPDHAMLAAAGWHGLMAQLPGMVAFKPHPMGPDQLHRVEHAGPVGELVKKLHGAGAFTHVLVPTRGGTTALVYDRGGRRAPYLQAAGLNFASAAGHGAVVGKKQLRDAARLGDMSHADDPADRGAAGRPDQQPVGQRPDAYARRPGRYRARV